MRHQVNRRGFIKRTGAGVLGLSAMNYTALAQGFGATGVLPSDKIVVGMIGVGGMGMSRLNGFLEHDDVEIAAICDVDTRHVDRAVSTVREKRNATPRTFHDYRDLLDMTDLDAVVVVTPDHWHALPTVHACEAGKDVFVEKPLSYSIGEGRAMVEAADQYQRVTQMGNHIHNDLSNYRRVVERVKSGQLGTVTRVQIWKSSGEVNRDNLTATETPPELDYDFWLGVAPKRPYSPLRSHGTWRYFWDYSGGDFMDFWCHISDVAYWALDLEAPERVSALGGRYFNQDDAETPDAFEAQFAFPGLNYIFSLHPGPMPGFEHMGNIGCIFKGTDATLVTSYGEHEVYVDGELVEDMPEPSMHIPDSPGHIREFLDAVKSRNMDTTCNVRYGHRLTKGGLLANVAYRSGTTVQWDNEREEIVGNEVAAQMLSDSFRHSWIL